MNTKLTLSIDQAVIVAAKNNLTKEKSLSGLIEDYFRALLATKNQRRTSSPLVNELTGLARLPQGADKQKIITDYLLEKYQ